MKMKYPTIMAVNVVWGDAECGQEEDKTTLIARPNTITSHFWLLGV